MAGHEGPKTSQHAVLKKKMLVYLLYVLTTKHGLQSQNPRTPIPPATPPPQLQLGVFRFLPTTHAETNANIMRP